MLEYLNLNRISRHEGECNTGSEEGHDTGRRYNRAMPPVIHISETEAARDFNALLDRVRAGAEVVIESEGGKLPVAVLRAPAPPSRSISECIALLPEDSTAVMDPEFARDVEAAIESHREPLEPPAWD